MHCNVFNRSNPRTIEIKRPTDILMFSLSTHIPTNASEQRLCIEIVPAPNTSISSLLVSTQSACRKSSLSFAKHLHRFTHAHPTELKFLCAIAKILTLDIEEAMDRIHQASQVCAKNGRPSISRKISISHINSGFNNEIQMDFTHCILKSKKEIIFHIVDTGTGWSETELVSDESIAAALKALERKLILTHGAPQSLSADDAYDKRNMHAFLLQHDIQYKPRPARRQNKLSHVERTNGTLKTILAKLNTDFSQADSMTLLSRATFLSNMFSGPKTLSSFQLSKGYSPSILGMPSTKITNELLEAHKEQTAVRALQILLDTRNPRTVPQEHLQPGRTI